MGPDVLGDRLDRRIPARERGKAIEIDGVELREALGQRCPQEVEVDQHGVLVEAFAARDHLGSVVVTVLVARVRILGLELMQRVERPRDANLKHSQAPPAGILQLGGRAARTRQPPGPSGTCG